jgi:hypothetical protein
MTDERGLPALKCPHGDTTCPCQDGDACHYEPTATTAAVRCPTTGRTDGGCCQGPQTFGGWRDDDVYDPWEEPDDE